MFSYSIWKYSNKVLSFESLVIYTGDGQISSCCSRQKFKSRDEEDKVPVTRAILFIEKDLKTI